MPSHSILVCSDKITARHNGKQVKAFPPTPHIHEHASLLSHSQSHTFIQTRIIHYFISVLRSTYREAQTKFTATGHIHRAKPQSSIQTRACVLVFVTFRQISQEDELFRSYLINFKNHRLHYVGLDIY